MSEGGYKIKNQEAIHFITFAVTEWVDVFAAAVGVYYFEHLELKATLTNRV